MQQLHVDRRDISRAEIVTAEDRPLADGAVRLSVALFALTANNVTYAALGEGALGYWDFFPARPGWGGPPCWGFAVIADSRAPGVVPGARVFGFLPVADTFDVFPARISPAGFFDGAPHRSGKSSLYNLYQRTAVDPAYDPDFEPEQALWADKDARAQEQGLGEMFFVPAYAAQRVKADPGLSPLLARDALAFYPVARRLLGVSHVRGPAAIAATWERLCAGAVPARDALVCSF